MAEETTSENTKNSSSTSSSAASASSRNSRSSNFKSYFDGTSPETKSNLALAQKDSPRKKMNNPSTQYSSNMTNTTTSTFISQNCKRFNHLFHCSSSEDSTSSSDTIIDVTANCSTSTSTTSAAAASTSSKSRPNANGSGGKLNANQYFSNCKDEEQSSSTNKGSKIESSDKVMTNHRISQLLSTTSSNSSLEPVLDLSVPVKIEDSSIKRRKTNSGHSNTDSEDRAQKSSSRRNSRNSDSNSNSHRRKSTDSNNWYDMELEIEVQVDDDGNETEEVDAENTDTDQGNRFSNTASAGGDLEDNDVDQELDIDDEDDEESKTKEKKKLVNKMNKKSRKLLLQLTENEKRKSSRLVSKTTFCNKKHDAQVMKRLKQIIKKLPAELTSEDTQYKAKFPTLVKVIQKRLETRLLATERLKEFEDTPDDLEVKCSELAKVIKHAEYLVIYTGAGISTSALIPDYRGPNGIWTLLRNGQSLETQSDRSVLTTANPTLTHMAIKTLHSERIIKHIVSQNCDGLHLRSGIPKAALSEVHGNMYVEVCTKCNREYVRSFDVTENTRRYEHRTGRHCYHCGSQLKDTVVHFGERGSLRWPLNWAGAEYNVSRADVILCMGSSLKVLRRYPWLWGMDLPVNKRPRLFIVNLQWTPKDQFAALKIHGKCDEVMANVMSKLRIPITPYERETDQIFTLATPLHESEVQSKSVLELAFPPNKPWPPNPEDMKNYLKYEPIFNVPIPIPVDLKIKKEEDELSNSNSLSNYDSTTLRSPNHMNESDELHDDKKDIVKYKKKTPKKRDLSTIIKGNGNGWLGNVGRGMKQPKKRKTSSSKFNV